MVDDGADRVVADAQALVVDDVLVRSEGPEFALDAAEIGGSCASAVGSHSVDVVRL